MQRWKLLPDVFTWQPHAPTHPPPFTCTCRPTGCQLLSLVSPQGRKQAMAKQRNWELEARCAKGNQRDLALGRQNRDSIWNAGKPQIWKILGGWKRDSGRMMMENRNRLMAVATRKGPQHHAYLSGSWLSFLTLVRDYSTYSGTRQMAGMMDEH